MRTFRLAATALVTALMAGTAVGAQDDGELGPVPQPVSVFLLDKPTVSVNFNGAYGLVRVTGALERAPDEVLRLRTVMGAARDARWTEVRGLNLVDYPREGLPAGTYQAAMVSDPPAITQIQGAGIGRDYTAQSGAWRVTRLPEGELTLSGAPYGSITIPVSRVTSFQIEPIRGNVTQFPQGQVRVEVLEGKTVSLPLPEILTLQRDQSRGTVQLTLADGQVFTGKLVELPNVNIPVTTTGGPVSVPLSRVSYLERTPPGGRLL